MSIFEKVWRMNIIGFGLALFFIVAANGPAPAKDLNVLVRILYAAFLAEQGAAMCLVPSISLSVGDRAVFSDAKTYAQWIKQRVSADLELDEVQFILKAAADKAKGEMNEVVKVLKSYPPSAEYAELTRWCSHNMKPIAVEVVGAYLSQRDTMDQLIEKSKRD